MRLIRLTSSSEGTFENNFNESLVIKPNAKIGLSSASITNVDDSLILKGGNRDILYQYLQDGTISKITLEEKVYDASNFEQLIIDIQDKLNSNVELKLSGSATNPSVQNKGLGLEWRVDKNTAGNIEIGYMISGLLKVSSALNSTTNNYYVKGASLGVSTTSDIIFNNTNTGVGSTQIFFCSKRRLSRGCGVFRGQINTLMKASEYNSPNNELTQGLDFGITSNKPLDADTALTKGFDFGIRIRTANSDTSSGAFSPRLNQYTIITQGDQETEYTGIDCGYHGAGDDKNDYLEIVHQGEKIILQVYHDNTASPTVLREFTDVKFGQMSFYPAVAIHGASVNNPPSNFTTDLRSSLRRVRNTISPYDTLSEEQELHVEDDGDLGTPVPPVHNGSRFSQNFFQFNSLELAEFMGFTSVRQPVSSNIQYDGSLRSDSGILFKADNKYNKTINQNSFLVVLDSIQLKSYDGLPTQEQRKSILAVIPNAEINSEDKIVYERENPHMIDVNNDRPLQLRTIKARLLDEEYNGVNTNGLCVLVLVIED